MEKLSTRNIPSLTFFGKNLKFLRTRMAYSQSKLADAIAIKRNNIASYEGGLAEPNALNFLKICAALSVDPSLMLSIDIGQDPSILDNVNVLDSVVDYDMPSVLDGLENETEEVNKILEGHRLFLKRFNEHPIPEANETSFYLLENIVANLESLVKANKDFIASSKAENL